MAIDFSKYGTPVGQQSGSVDFSKYGTPITSIQQPAPVAPPSLWDKLTGRAGDVVTSFSPQTPEQKREYTPIIKPITGTLGAAGGAVFDVIGSAFNSIVDKARSTEGGKLGQTLRDNLKGKQLFKEGTAVGDFEKKINESMSKWASDMIGGAEYGYQVSKEQNPKSTAIAKDLFDATGLLGTGAALKGLKADIATTKQALTPTAEQQVAKYTKAVTEIASDYEKALPLTPTQKAKEGVKLEKTGDNVYTTLAKNGIEVGSGNEISQLNEISNLYDNAISLAQQNEHQLFSMKRILNDAITQIDERITSSVAREAAKAKIQQEIASLLSEPANKALFFTDSNGEIFIKSSLVERLRKTGNSWTPFNAADPEKIGMSTGYALSNAVRNEVEAFGTFPAYREALREWGKVINATDILSNIEKAGKPFRAVGGLSGSVARRVLSGALGYHMGGIGGALLSEIGSEYAARIISNPQLRTYFNRRIVESALAKNPTPEAVTKLKNEIQNYVYEQTKRAESGLLLPEPAIRLGAETKATPQMEVTRAATGKPYQVPKGQPGAGQMRRVYTSESAQPKIQSQSTAMSTPSKMNPKNAIPSTVQRTRDLRKADKAIVAKKNIKKTPEIKKIEDKIKENVKAQKAAIKAKDYTLVAKLKEAYDILVTQLKKAIKYLNENGSVGMSIKKTVTPESVAKRADDADMGVLDYVIRDYDNAILDPNVNRTLSDMGLGKATREERIRFAKEVFDEQAGVGGKVTIKKDANDPKNFKTAEEFVKAHKRLLQTSKGDAISSYDIQSQREWLGGDTVPSTGKIVVYRASADGVSIKAGDYITNERSYALDHIKNNLGGEGEVVQQLVSADEMLPADAPKEFWYRPQHIPDNLLESQLIDIWKKANRKDVVLKKSDDLAAQAKKSIKPFEKTLYRGSGGGGLIARPDIGNALGEGRYYAGLSHAVRYGKNIEEKVVKLKNPLYIKTDQDLRNITGGKNLVVSEKTGVTPEMVKKQISEVRKKIIEQGYDGVVIEMANYQDTQNLRRLFEHDQVIVY